MSEEKKPQHEEKKETLQAEVVSESTQSVKNFVDQIDKFLEDLLVKQAPALPKGFKEWIVRYLPIINIITIIFTAIGALGILSAALGLGAISGVLGIRYLYFYGPALIIGSLFYAGFSIAEIYFKVLAQPGLDGQKHAAWTNLFYSVLISIIGTLLYNTIISSIIAGLFSAAIGALISLYFLYQIKSYYKNK
jgi:hypothetical protein